MLTNPQSPRIKRSTITTAHPAGVSPGPKNVMPLVPALVPALVPGIPGENAGVEISFSCRFVSEEASHASNNSRLTLA